MIKNKSEKEIKKAHRDLHQNSHSPPRMMDPSSAPTTHQLHAQIPFLYLPGGKKIIQLSFLDKRLWNITFCYFPDIIPE